MPIKNIILDLGNVLLDVDYDLTTQAFEKLGYDNFKEMYSKYAVDQLFEKLETGTITEDEFYFVITEIRENVTTENVMDAWNAMLLDFRWDSFDYLQKLKRKYRLFLLSNTNAVHKTAFEAIFREHKGKSMDDWFEKAYYSHLVGYRKPEKNIFEFVIQDAGIEPAESLFIDDLYNNIETASEMGFKTHLLKPGETIEAVIPGYLTSS